MGGSLPFVGRAREAVRLRQLLAEAPTVVVHGLPGCGASRLVREVTQQMTAHVVFVSCHHGDTMEPLLARIERGLQCTSGRLAQRLTETEVVLVLDQAHRLKAEVTAAILAMLAPPPLAFGRLVLTAHDALANPMTLPSTTLQLEGLSENDTLELFDVLTAQFGPVDVANVERDLWLQTRGLPAAVLGWFAAQRIARSDDAPLQDAVVARLAVLRLPIPVAAVPSLMPDTAPAAVMQALQEAVAQQRLEIGPGDVVRARVALPGADESVRAAHRAAVVWWQSQAATMDALTGCEELATHLLALAEAEPALAQLLAAEPLAHAHGGATLLLALASVWHARAESVAVCEFALRICVYARRMHDARLWLQRLRRLRELAPGKRDQGEPYESLLALVATGQLAAAKRQIGEPTAQTAWLALELDQLQGAGGALTPVALNTAHGVEDGSATGRDTLLPEGADGALLVAWVARLAFARGEAAAVGVAEAAIARCVGHAAAQGPALRLQALVVRGLLAQGRVGEANTRLHAMVRGLMFVVDPLAHDGYAHAQAQVFATQGNLRSAGDTLRALMTEQRVRGDELAAVNTELALAEVELLRGHVVGAAELATVVRTSTARMGCEPWRQRAELILAQVELLELRADKALARMHALQAAQLGAWHETMRSVASAQALALLGRHGEAQHAALDLAARLDDAPLALARGEIALAMGDMGEARDQLTKALELGERVGRKLIVVQALALLARVHLGRGDRTVARACATRAAREAATTEQAHARCTALLALAALARIDDETATGVAYARDAAELAAAAGLPAQRFVAYAALDALSGPEAVADPAAPSAANLAPAAFDLCGKMLAELGLTSQRPFALVDATGATSEVVDASPEMLQLAKRALAVDGVRESIWRQGQELADLRRRSLLKKLLFLFASSPGQIFTKEAIVSAVWNVEYHPLRHDAALFTNIMRIRRLLGDDGSEIIRVVDDGYRFVPPPDFVFVFAR